MSSQEEVNYKLISEIIESLGYPPSLESIYFEKPPKVYKKDKEVLIVLSKLFKREQDAISTSSCL